MGLKYAYMEKNRPVGGWFWISALVSLFVLALVPQATAAEPLFPRAGSQAYDVSSYQVRLAYEAGKGGRIKAAIKIVAVAKQRLSSVSLDFLGPSVTEVKVGGDATNFERKGGKLIASAGELIPKGSSFITEVHYEGRPPTITDADLTQEGWYRTDDGVLAVGEPRGTAAWIPCNNVPTDKASFRFEVSVPSGLKAVANGRLRAAKREGKRTRYTWFEPTPMSTYLAVLDIGRGRLVKTRADGLPAWTLVDPRLQRQSRLVLAELPRIIRFESKAFGPYPFPSAGSIVDFAPPLGYALESQSRPIYAFTPDVTTVVHETAHQWFGDSVGLKRWPNIWLNEGFATWAQWYYAEHHGGRSAEAIFKRLYRVPASNREFWNPPPGHPGVPRNLFYPSVYVRGAMALEALRLQIGTQPMLEVLRTWASEHRHGNGDIEEFIALAERISGQNLEPLFQRWLYQRGKP